MTERISDERLEQLRNIAEFSAFKASAMYELELALRELQQRRSGQWICPGCHLRQDGPREDAGF